MTRVGDPDGPCHRCGGPLCLTATIPLPGVPVARPLSLCPRCDAHDPDAQGLLAWFAISGTVDEHNLPEFRRLAEQWAMAKQAAPSGISERQAADDLTAWRRGEYE